MSRLIAFGCSNTYGEALPDCWPWESMTAPSKLAWPQILANTMKRQCINLSEPGVSNKYICNKILETEFQKSDVVFIMWTYYTRTCFFNDDGSVQRIMIQDIDNKHVPKEWGEKSLNYYKNFYTDTDCVLDTFVRFNLVKYYLDSLGINNFHYTCNREKDRNKYFDKDLEPSWSTNVLSEQKMQTIDRALDGVHPGIKSHALFAKNISKELKRKYP